MNTYAMPITRISSALNACLEGGDVRRLRSIWSQVYPKMPQPKSHEEAEVVFHQARAAANSVSAYRRQYSHVWLGERGHRSDLPYELKSKAEQQGRPVIVEAVGIAVKSFNRSTEGRERVTAIRTAMENAVLEAMGDGVTDPNIVRAQMALARKKMRMQ